MNTPVILAFFASIFWGVGTAMQKHGMATEFPKITLKKLLRQIGLVVKTLFSTPIWLIGLITMTGGMLCFAYALASGDISLVQPLVNLTMVVAAIIGVIFLHEKVSGIEWAGIGVILSGAVFIALAGGEQTSVQPSVPALALITVLFSVLVALALFVDRLGLRLRPEFTLSAATGFCFGLANIMGKVMTQRVIDRVGEFSLLNPECLLAIPVDFPIWIVIATNILGAVLFQAAFANGRVSLVSPVVTIIANTTPVIVAVAAFREEVGWARILGICLAVAGTGMLAAKKEEGEPDER